MKFPTKRMRRLRYEPWMRKMVEEHALRVEHLIWPLFVTNKATTPIESLPGQYRYSIEDIVKEVQIAKDLGIPSIALFPATPESVKTEEGEESYNPNNLICNTVRAIKMHVPDIGIICDVALDPYTTHGQDGVIRKGRVDNDETLDILATQALNQVRAGCDIIAPSDMMDGRIGIIRKHLDLHGFSHIPILAYSAKYASAFYGPFRDAVGSKSALGKRGKESYQMNPANGDEAMTEVLLDIEEGADMVMVKPGMPYLDIVRRVKEVHNIPTFVYQVSGEYAMLKAASQNGWLDWDKVIMESLLAFVRAGADGILTYAAKEIAQKLHSKK
jgi:porphobilinogen synthase